MKDLVFATSAPNKYHEVVKLLSEHAAILQMHLLEELQLSVPPFSNVPEQVEEAKKLVGAVYSKIKKPCFVELSGISLDNCGFFSAKSFFDIGEDEFAKKYQGTGGITCVVVAFMSDGTNVELFQGELEGKVVLPRGEQGLGWERIWLPDGYSHTISEMYSNKFVLNMRHRPYLELACRLRERDYQGVFEAHITVDGHNDATTRDMFVKVCEQLGCKSILIELPSGVEMRQMMTSSYHRGALKGVQLEAFQLAQKISKNGFTITRVKVEAMMSNAGVPQTDEEVSLHSPENYFEFHIKLLLGPDADLGLLQKLVHEHSAKLSNNSLKVLANGYVHRFVTQRMYGVGRVTAENRLNDCMKALENSGFTIASRMREYAVYDTNVKLDSGWIDKINDYKSECLKPGFDVLNIRSS
eukprot:Phypoly_transcript_10597.p1 GENE.Phypoly_transcript_10597~~Phypoly_transcript_10597.p1  ORF type:complete len:421 (+),score=39.26 Phypoly_transcript_10597:30-1265(+)